MDPIKSYTVVLYCEQKQKTFTVDLEADTKMGELSNQLADNLDCQEDERLVLYFQNKKLHYDSTLEQNGIEKGGKIDIKIEKNQRNASNNQNLQNIPNQNESQVISLIIEVPIKNMTYTIKISLNKKIKELITEVQGRLNLSADQTITFIFQGKSLNKVEATLEQSGLTNNSRLAANIVRIGGF